MTYEDLKKMFGTKYPSLGFTDAEIEALKAEQEQLAKKKRVEQLFAQSLMLGSSAQTASAQMMAKPAQHDEIIRYLAENLADQFARYLRDRVRENMDDPKFAHMRPEEFVRSQFPVAFSPPASKDEYVRVPGHSRVLRILGAIIRLPQTVRGIGCTFLQVRKTTDNKAQEEVLDLTIRLTSKNLEAKCPPGLESLLRLIDDQLTDPEYQMPTPLPSGKDALKEFLAKEDEL